MCKQTTNEFAECNAISDCKMYYQSGVYMIVRKVGKTIESYRYHRLGCVYFTATTFYSNDLHWKLHSKFEHFFFGKTGLVRWQDYVQCMFNNLHT